MNASEQPKYTDSYECAKQQPLTLRINANEQTEYAGKLYGENCFKTQILSMQF